MPRPFYPFGETRQIGYDRLAAGIEPGSPEVAEACPARRGGDLGSSRKPAGADFRPLRTTGESPFAAPQKKTFGITSL